MIYLWTKTLHLVFVIAWMATVFYLPRILVNLAETRGQPDVQARLALMGQRLYRFGHSMFGIAVVLGFVLWLGYRFAPGTFPDIVAGRGWMHMKLGLVVALLAYFIVAGRRHAAVFDGPALVQRAAAAGAGADHLPGACQAFLMLRACA
jgi:putative membrane protein